jgi:hypothetical protein
MKRSYKSSGIFSILIFLLLSNLFAAPSPAIPLNKLGEEADKKMASQGVTVTAEGLRLTCPLQRLEAYISPTGAIIRSVSETEGRGDFSITPVILGRTNKTSNVPAVGTVATQDNRSIMLDRELMAEQFSSSSDGIRQDFIIARRPAGKGAMSLSLLIKGAQAADGNNGIALAIPTGRKFIYGNLKATDANGKELAATMEAISRGELKITVNDLGAKYPVTIDPTITDADWVAMVGDYKTIITDGAVTSLALSNSGTLYIGGYFTVINNASAKGVAKWDGSTWTGLGSTDFVDAIALDSSGTLYAVVDSSCPTWSAGAIIQIIKQWKGVLWTKIGNTQPIVNNAPKTQLSIDKTGNLYLLGNFDYTSSFPHTISRIAKWNKTTWIDLDTGISIGNYILNALALDSAGNVFVCGYFRSIGGVTVNGFAKWDGANWFPFGTEGKNITILSIDNSGNIYAGGKFDTIGGVTAKNLAVWNGITWSALGSGTNGSVSTFQLDKSGNLYASGTFDTIGGILAKNIAVWNGTTWSALGSGVRGISALACDNNGDVYAGGSFDSAGGVVAKSIAEWNGIMWSRLGLGKTAGDITGGAVYACAIDGNKNLYIGGNFTKAGGIAAHGIAKWDGSNWDSLGSGITGGHYNPLVGGYSQAVLALATDRSGNLYAGGNFTSAGGIAVSNIAKWNGSSWDSLGSGIDSVDYTFFYFEDQTYYSTVLSLIIDRIGNLYVGGEFSKAGGNTARSIAKWDGIKWDTVGHGMTCYFVTVFDHPIIRALGIDDSGNLYAGGTFDYADYHSVRNIAKWNGTGWSALGSGFNSGVKAITIDGHGTLYAGGYFVTSGVDSVKRIAQWNGSKWDSLGSGANSFVCALACDSSNTLYVGGDFDTAGGVVAHKIAKWDGNKWDYLGSGTDSAIYSLKGFDSTLFVGGKFTDAGKKYSPNFADVNVHAFLSSIIPHPAHISSSAPIRYRVRNSVLYISNVSSRDRISLYSLSGRCLREAEGVSVMKLPGIASQPLIIRVKRSNKIVSTGMVMVQ